ncbi:MAG: Hsp20/alpha crystallin family protein [Candidatus Thermoplasmatota archaeon]|jgi:HSP20 family molecular chaperone IbpA|nr:Hsp20/alpha crystallin family protein [Candidatus Thermoplasmatota archaeon]MCL5441235.1 Hsp20/alpha crystallin family protein [Candidatus Thermoplasmatota archaeon]
MAGMDAPLKFYADEFMKGVGNRVKEVMSFVYPPVTMYEESGEIVIEADLPGFKKDNIRVVLEKNALSISARRELNKSGMTYMDQRPESVHKRISLPLEIDYAVDYTAKYEEGVLTIKIPVKGIKTVKVE